MQRNVSDDQLILLSVILILPVLIILTLWWAVDPLYSTDSAITVSFLILSKLLHPTHFIFTILCIAVALERSIG